MVSEAKLSARTWLSFWRNMPKFNAKESFDFSQPTTWLEWRERSFRFRVATKLHNESSEVQVASVVRSGLEGREDVASLRSSFSSTSWGTTSSQSSTWRWTRYAIFVFQRDNYVIHERAKFHSRGQASEQSIERYVRALYVLSAHCVFTESGESIRERLVLGLQDTGLSQKLQLETTLTLKTDIKTARHDELVKSHVSDQRHLNVDAAVGQHKRGGSSHSQYDHPSRRGRGGRGRGGQPRPNQQHQQSCGKCGRKHGPNNLCPAKGKTCRLCCPLCCSL